MAKARTCQVELFDHFEHRASGGLQGDGILGDQNPGATPHRECDRVHDPPETADPEDPEEVDPEEPDPDDDPEDPEEEVDPEEPDPDEPDEPEDPDDEVDPSDDGAELGPWRPSWLAPAGVGSEVLWEVLDADLVEPLDPAELVLWPLAPSVRPGLMADTSAAIAAVAAAVAAMIHRRVREIRSSAASRINADDGLR